MDLNAEETRFEKEGEPQASLQSGERLGNYRIVRLLGRGGMGEVFLAEQVALKQQYALKVLPAEAASNPGFVRRFEEEAQILAKLDHPNIVRVHYAGSDRGRYYLAMEHAGGGSLEDELQARGGRLPPAEVRDILLRVLKGLAYAHEGDASEKREAVMHRDLKPANILRTAGGEIKISDFGLARVVGEEFV